MFNFEDVHIHWVNRLGVLGRRELVHRFEDAGHRITAEEWAILLLLWRDDAQSPGDMSSRTFRDPTTMTRLIDGMVKKDLVHRRESPTDRRRSLVCLTDQGKAIRAKLVPLAQDMIERANIGIAPDDLETTLRVLGQMTENLMTPWKSDT